MAFTYEFEIKQMSTRDQGEKKDAVIQVYWMATGTNEVGASATFTGSTPLTAESVAPSEFIPFEQLTPEIVTGWIKAMIASTPGYQEHIDFMVQEQINNQDIKTKPLPWA